MKVSILCCYYNRPNMIRFALDSVKRQSYKNWEFIFVDDSSKIPGKPIVEEVLSDYLDKVKFYNTNDPEKKEGNGKSVFGKYWNIASLESDSDISIMLCDDDALTLDYLSKLVEWYENNSDKGYSYCHLNIFDPYSIKCLDQIESNTDYILNKIGPINPYGALDASQVSWRTDAIRSHNVRFPYPQTHSLDATLYGQLCNLYGPCHFNNIIGQYKGIHFDQLNKRFDPDNDQKTYSVTDLHFLPS